MPLRLLKFHGKLDLLVPSLVIAEFDRNRPRSEMAVTTSVLDRLRQLRRELREYAGEQHQRIWLEATAPRASSPAAPPSENRRSMPINGASWSGISKSAVPG